MQDPAPALPLPVHLRFHRGLLRCGPWFDGRLPPGCAWSAARGAPWFEAPASRHRLLRRHLNRRGLPVVDGLPVPERLPAALPAPALPAALQLAMAAFRGSGRRGLVLGAGDAERTALALAAIAGARRAAVLLAPTEAAVDGWIAALRPRLLAAVGRLADGEAPPPVAVAAVAPFATLAERCGARFRLLVADGCDRVPLRLLQHGLSCCAASQRLGFLGRQAPAQLLGELAGSLGPVLHLCESGSQSRHVLQLPLRADERAEFAAGWSAFLGAFDRFAALAPTARFGEFVRWARGDEVGRPGLAGWHRAMRALRLPRAKAAACELLLQRHRRERLLFFTADRESAYALCRRCHALPVTAELPAAARRQALAAWADGLVPALCGPRLLEEAHGLPAADVGVVVGGAFGRAQLQARRLRVREGGAFYQLVAAGTIEAARALRDDAGA